MDYGTPVLSEVVSASTTTEYSKNVLYPFSIVRLLPTADMDFKFCREYMPVPQMGQRYDDGGGIGTGPEVGSEIWASDAEGAELSNVVWKTGEMVTTSQVTLDKTKGNLAYTRVLEFLLDDQDDVIRARLGAAGRYGRFPDMPLASLMFSINHIESDAAKPLQVQFRKGPTGGYNYWTMGGGWGAGVVWNDITGSAVEAWLHLNTVTPDDADAGYSIALRPKDNYAAATSHISHIGLHETMAFGTANVSRLAQDVEYFFAVPYRSRIGVDMEAGTGKLYIDVMEGL